MIKLNSIVEKLEDVLMKIEDKIDALDERIKAIEDKAMDRDSGKLTTREKERIEAIDEEIDNLRYERDEIENALSYLNVFTCYE